jgi:pyruvate kinase
MSKTILDFSQPLLRKEEVMVVCRVENDGVIKENKPIYIPRLDWQKDLKLSVLGHNDVRVLHNSIQKGVDMIAVSCVESKDDLIYVKKILGSKGQHIKVLAKLQSLRALENFDSILETADGIIIARGYLGLSLDLEDVVYVQKYIIKQCNTVGKPVLIST